MRGFYRVESTQRHEASRLNLLTKGSEEAPRPPWVPPPGLGGKDFLFRKPPRARRGSLWVAGAWAKISPTPFQREEHSLGLVTDGRTPAPAEDTGHSEEHGFGDPPCNGAPTAIPKYATPGEGSPF